MKTRRHNLKQRLVSEAIGTGFLVAAVVGSGIMVERLAGGNGAVALLVNTIATGAALIALICTFGPISGAHLNPAVSLADAIEGGITLPEMLAYIAAQCTGGIGGTIAAHLMFDLPWYSPSTHARNGSALLFSEGKLRTSVRYLGMLAAGLRHSAVCSCQLHHRSVLVHFFDIFRESCRDAGSLIDKHIHRHQTRGCAAVCSRANCGSVNRHVCVSLARSEPSRNRPSGAGSTSRHGKCARMKTVLFACVHNAGRSQIAAAWFSGASDFG